jgi:hypothetical protein
MDMEWMRLHMPVSHPHQFRGAKLERIMYNRRLHEGDFEYRSSRPAVDFQGWIWIRILW